MVLSATQKCIRVHCNCNCKGHLISGRPGRRRGLPRRKEFLLPIPQEPGSSLYSCTCSHLAPDVSPKGSQPLLGLQPIIIPLLHYSSIPSQQGDTLSLRLFLKLHADTYASVRQPRSPMENVKIQASRTIPSYAAPSLYLLLLLYVRIRHAVGGRGTAEMLFVVSLPLPLLRLGLVFFYGRYSRQRCAFLQTSSGGKRPKEGRKEGRE